MPDLLTKDALPNDINSKLLASELFNLFFGGGSMGEWVATLSASGSAQPLRGFFEPAGCNESDGIAHSVRAEVHNHDDVSMASHTHSVRAQWDAQTIPHVLLACFVSWGHTRTTKEEHKTRISNNHNLALNGP